MLTENEMEDYVVFRSLEKLYEQRPTRNDLKLRLDNLKSGEAFICMFEAFERHQRENSFRLHLPEQPDLATKSVIMILTVPSKDLSPSTLQLRVLRKSGRFVRYLHQKLEAEGNDGVEENNGRCRRG